MAQLLFLACTFWIFRHPFLVSCVRGLMLGARQVPPHRAYNKAHLIADSTAQSLQQSPYHCSQQKAHLIAGYWLSLHCRLCPSFLPHLCSSSTQSSAWALKAPGMLVA
eukprot:scaffold55381_cov22-Tisochrysis_lutea.AAC.1